MAIINTEAAARGGQGLRGAIGIFLCLIWLQACIPIISQNGPEFREILLQGEGIDKIILLDINGIISNEPLLLPNVGVVPGMTSRIRQELEIAALDPHVRGVLLRINSGGGTLTDSDIIYHSLMEFKKSKKVKIMAAMGDIAASGALYIAMAADEIYAHPTTLTGSIGVILPHLDYSGLMKKLGIRSDPVASGQYKDIDSPYRPRTGEEDKMLRAVINEQHRKFVEVIKNGRPKMKGKDVERLADGRLISASGAKDAGLVDQLGYLDDAYKRLSRLSGFPRNRLMRYSNAWLTGNNIYSNAFPVEIFPTN